MLDDATFRASCQIASGVGQRYVGASMADFPSGIAVDSEKDLLICGPNNTGKTHMAAALCGEFAAAGLSCEFIHAPECASRLRLLGHLDPHSRLATVDVLFLDDITAVLKNEYNLDLIFRLMDLRYKEDRRMVVTANRDADQWKDIHGALWKMISGFERIVLKEVWNG